MKVVTLKAEPRAGAGTAHARRLRRAGALPAVVYGEGREPRHIAVDTRAFRHALDHGARVIDLEMDEIGAARVLLKDVQWDALGVRVVHADFLRLHPEHELELAVPLHFEGTPKGLSSGGVMTVLSDTLEVACLPADIPEFITVVVADLDVGGAVHAGEIPLPERVRLAVDAADVIVSVAIPRAPSAPADAGEGDEAAEGDAAEGASSEDAD